ncbi:transcription factor 25 [Puma concolor]|uniref:Transcription factor 25 n=1 Tax=Puma concolor TaxID=9696 RepID=A0A6P6HLK3_PUMCO|nr:transcription factor 25 [Puma concolor]
MAGVAILTDSEVQRWCWFQGPGDAGGPAFSISAFPLVHASNLKINIEDLEEGPVLNGERPECLLTGNRRRSQSGGADVKKAGEVAGKAAPPEQSNISGKLRKKKKKQKNKKNTAGEILENGLEDIDRILERIEDGGGLSRPGPPPLSSKKHVLYVEHRHLNPDTELKRYFGARAVLGEQSAIAQEWVFPCGVSTKSLRCLPNTERALYSMECAFHPLFSLTSGTCRLDYRRPENRSFYLALYKQMSFLEKRGCPRTALEFCKLILSLEPDEDPLCMLLLIDHLALRARNYDYLIRLFQEWEAHRNLSQLPNFAFSVPLAYFLLSQQADLPEQELSSAREQASLLIRQALTMFPGALLPLLEYCSVRPDAAVATHSFFGPDAEISQPPALSQLVSLYLGRSHFLWKEPATMSWLEENVREVLRAVDSGDPAVEACESRRKVLYQRAPRNIHRHVVLSEVKEAVAALPPDVTTQSVMGFDPLPPLDTIYSYVRPERLSPVSHGNTIALFFRSLLPNYTMEGERLEAGGAGGLNHNQGLNRLMLAVRDMMANFHFHDVEAAREDNPEGDGEWD